MDQVVQTHRIGAEAFRNLAARVWRDAKWLARKLRTVVCVLLLAFTAVCTFFIAQPAIDRWLDFIAFFVADRSAPSSDDERLVASLRSVVGAESASKMKIQVLGDFTNVDISDSETAAVRIDQIADTPPGGDLYWVPRAGSVTESYGLMMATLLDARKDELRLDEGVRAALVEYLDTAEKRLPSTVRRHEGVMRRNAAFAAATRVLRERLRGTASSDGLLRDFRQYIGLADLELPTTYIPGLNGWLAAQSDSPLERIADGELTLATYSPAGDTRLSPVTVRATIYAPQPQLLELQRPAWFRHSTIETARERARTSNSFSRFFGANGSMSSVPTTLFVVKDPVYEIHVNADDVGKLGEGLDDPDAAIVVQYSGGKLIVPAATSERMRFGSVWQLKPLHMKARVVAVVSTIY